MTADRYNVGCYWCTSGTMGDAKKGVFGGKELWFHGSTLCGNQDFHNHLKEDPVFTYIANKVDFLERKLAVAQDELACRADEISKLRYTLGEVSILVGEALEMKKVHQSSDPGADRYVDGVGGSANG